MHIFHFIEILCMPFEQIITQFIYYSTSQDYYLGGNLKIKSYPFPVSLSKMIWAGVSLSSDGFKSKVKLSPNKINANLVFGDDGFGVGAKGAFNLNTLKIGNYGFLS